MKVIADHWVKCDGRWYQPGETYDDGNAEVREEPEQTAEAAQEDKPKKTRKRTVKE